MTINSHALFAAPLKVFCTVAFLAAFSGTSAQARSTLRGIAPGATIHIVGTQPQIKVPDARTAGESVATATALGAIGGAAYGGASGLMMGFECEEMFIICGPVGLVFGAAGGLLIGGGEGGGQAASVALPKEKASKLEVILASLINGGSLPEALVQEFKAQSQQRWNVVDGPASTEIMLGIKYLSIHQTRNDHVMMFVTNTMVLRYGPDPTNTSKRILSTYRSEKRHIDYWIENDGVNLRSEIHAGFAANFGDMIEVLETYAP